MPDIRQNTDATGRVIGFELLHYRPSSGDPRLAVETVIHTNTQVSNA